MPSPVPSSSPSPLIVHQLAGGTKWPSEAFGLGMRVLAPWEILLYGKLITDYYAVNIGALDGGYADGDPVNQLWFDPTSNARWRERGLAIEGVEKQCAQLKQQVVERGATVTVECSFAIPRTIVKLMQSHQVPREFDFLKIDIDSLDCPVLDAILTYYHPRYIRMEINFDIPPPVVFSLEYSPAVAQDWFWSIIPPKPRTLL